MGALNRLWIVIAFGWAGCCLWGGLDAYGTLDSKTVYTAFAPFAIMAVLRWIVLGPRARRTR
jgi:hypothetical protein